MENLSKWFQQVQSVIPKSLPVAIQMCVCIFQTLWDGIISLKNTS